MESRFEGVMYVVYMIYYRKSLNLYIKTKLQMLLTFRLLPVDAVYARIDGHGVCRPKQKKYVVQCESVSLSLPDSPPYPAPGFYKCV